MNIVLHPRTKSALENYLKHAAQTFILSGSEGNGKYYTATWLARAIGGTLYTVQPLEDKKIISIDQIRALYALTQTDVKLVIIIKDAHTMGHEAQNAFLKLLEEPSKNTFFILTSAKNNLLLPTIRSRAQTVEIIPPSTAESLAYAQTRSDLDESEIRSLLATTQNHMGVFTTMLKQGATREAHQKLVNQAKRFYGATAYERHCMCIEEKYEKEWIHQLLKLLATIVQTLLKQPGQNREAIKRLTHQAQTIEVAAHALLTLPGNPKIHLSQLIIEL